MTVLLYAQSPCKVVCVKDGQTVEAFESLTETDAVHKASELAREHDCRIRITMQGGDPWLDHPAYRD